MNMNPKTVADFNQIPVKFTRDTPMLLGQVAPVSDTHQPQSNVVRIDGKPATFLMVIKHADASTLAVVNGVKKRIPDIETVAPKGMKVKLTFYQSTFVRAALEDVVQEAVTAALLVALMVLVFLGSPRSMLIVITSIPLSILTAIIWLKLTGQTINTMTLGGIAGAWWLALMLVRRAHSSRWAQEIYPCRRSLPYELYHEAAELQREKYQWQQHSAVYPCCAILA